jgi:hypothetical protein
LALLKTGLATILLLALAAPCASAKPGPWELITNERGVKVQAREIPGQGLPEFRGIGMINGTIFEVLAVIDHTSNHPQWLANCTDAKLLRRLPNFGRIVYSRTKAPWPVDDRDVVLQGKLEVDPVKGVAISRFWATKSKMKSPVDGVVRMTRLRGFWKLSAITKKKTRVVYQVSADPGGILPDWVAEFAQKELPLETIAGLRRQVKKTRGDYDAFLQRYDPDHGGTIPDAVLKR